VAKTAPVALAMAILGAIVLVEVLAISTQQMRQIGSIGSLNTGFVLFLPGYRYILRKIEAI